MNNGFILPAKHTLTIPIPAPLQEIIFGQDRILLYQPHENFGPQLPKFSLT